MNPAAAPEPARGVIRLEIPGRAEWVAVARLAVAAVASRLHVSVDEIEDIKLAVAESCTNAIGRDPDGTIAIACEARAGVLVISVSDGGSSPHLGPIEDERISESGRTAELGVFLIRALMDEVEVTTSPRDGTTLVMTKRLPA